MNLNSLQTCSKKRTQPFEKDWLGNIRTLSLIKSNYQILVYDREQNSYGESETAKKALGYINFLKQPKFLFFLFYLQDLIAVLKPVALTF